MKAEDVLPAALSAAEACPDGIASLLREVLTASKVEVSDEVGSACIGPRPEGGWHMQLGRAFCEEHVLDANDALALIAHEVMHVARGHFTPRQGADPDAGLLNVALDVLVNATLLRRVIPGGAELFARVNPPDKLPAALLVPPRDLLVHAGANDDGAARLATLSHAELSDAWRTEGVTRADLHAVVTDALRARGARRPHELAQHLLVGWLEIPNTARWTEEMVRLLKHQFPQAHPPEAVLLGGHGQARLRGHAPHASGMGALRRKLDELDDHDPRRATSAATTDVLEAFVNAVKLALTEGEATTRRKAEVEVPSLVPGSSRRDTTLLAAGHVPVFWRGRMTMPSDAREGVHLYLDMSGSTHIIAPVYLALARGLGSTLIRPAWSWSEEVFPITERDILEDTYETTGGTDVSCVIEHALQRRARRLLVLTDGRFDVDGELIERTRQGGLDLVFLVHGHYVRQAKRLGRVLRVPDLERASGRRPRPPDPTFEDFPF